ncbi:hypothetical protein BV22DRAFT_223501 [Leucogyrophana mollusca]|uniref:Uncharacterized protein n=1 Tax=Leucogyrophana mollusca TaxID=85980 RepID=A0ACB8BSX9_9AGAM|nr:hypothetical protein BV22DRAFT_223501 [Leucogyrophana mollusca]
MSNVAKARTQNGSNVQKRGHFPTKCAFCGAKSTFRCLRCREVFHCTGNIRMQYALICWKLTRRLALVGSQDSLLPSFGNHCLVL